MGKNCLPVQEAYGMQVQSLGGEDSLEEGMVTHSSILAWRIPWTEKLGRLQSIESPRYGHDWSDLARVCTQTHTNTEVKMLKLIWETGNRLILIYI